MKKTLLALLLALCMLVAFTTVTVSAEETDVTAQAAHTDHCVCGGSAVGVHEHQCADATWTPLSAALTEAGLTMQTADFGKLPSGNYYLDGDVTVTAETTPAVGTADAPGQKLSVCLNGYNITGSGVKVFGYRKAFTHLNVCDCSGTQDAKGNWTWDGTVTAAAVDYGVANIGAGATAHIYGGNFIGQDGVAYGSCFNVSNDGYTSYPGYNTEAEEPRYEEYGTSLTVYNGYLKGGKTTNTGSVINAWHPTVEVYIYGGTIEGGGSAVGGGAINVGDGTLIAENATIIGSTAPRGGAIIIKNGSLTNCTIIGGQSLAKESYTGTTDYNCGGAIAAFGQVTIENTTISDGEAQIGGNLYVSASAVVTIKGNTVIENGKAVGSGYGVHGRGEGTASKPLSFVLYGQGGNVFVANKDGKVRGKVYMYGGEIRNGTADRTDSKTGTGGHGGNVSLFGEFYLYGGDIYGGKAMANPAYWYVAPTEDSEESWTAKGTNRGYGGNFYIGNANGGNLLQIDGGSIYDGQAYGNYGGNIYATRGDVKLISGKIWGGKANADDSVADKTATSGTNYSPLGTGDAVKGGSICILGFGSDSKIYGARFTMTGGSVGIDGQDNAAGGVVTSGGIGGNIYISRGTTYTSGTEEVFVKITGGTVANGAAPGGKGGNIGALGNDYITVGGTAIVRDGTAAYGGNIYGGMQGTFGTVNIEGGTVTNGTTTKYGGNCYISSKGKLNISGGTITEGECELGGGNIYADAATVTITGGTISNGTSSKSGGNMMLYSTTTIENASITGGTAGNMGGNIYTTTSLTLTDVTITGGEAKTSGGNLYAKKLTLNSGEISGGTAKTRKDDDSGVDSTDGGGNLYIPVGSTINIVGGTISGGTSKAGGGNIYATANSSSPTTINITGGTISGGTPAKGYNGGSIRTGSSYVTINIGTENGTTGPTLENGAATGSSGGGNIYSIGTVNVYSGTITGGSAGGNGGNIYSTRTLNVYGGTITGGTANKGGNIYSTKTLEISGGTITEGQTTGSTAHGGNIYNTGTATMSGGTVSDGYASNHGGNLTTEGSFTMTGGEFKNGEGTSGANIRISAGGTLTLDGGTITGGKCRSLSINGSVGGNTIIVVGDKSTGEIATLTVKSGTITGSSSNAVNGATIAMSYGSVVNVEGGTITGGTAQDRDFNNLRYHGRGGVFSLYGSTYEKDGVTTNYPAVLNISGGTIQNGAADSYGGLISTTLESNPVEINISGGTFLGGEAVHGGQMWLTGGANVTISGGTFSGGTALGRAPGIYLADANLKIVGAPVLQTIHMAPADGQLLDVTEMTAEPVEVTFEQTGVYNVANAGDVFASIKNNQGFTVTQDGNTVHVSNTPTVVYVSNNGSDSNNGTAEAPFKTLNFALMTVADQGTVHIVDVVDMPYWDKHDKQVTITDGELNVTAEDRLELQDHVSFKNLNLVMPQEEYYFYCDGYTTLIDQDVSVYYIIDGERSTVSNKSYLYGGSRLNYTIFNGELSGTNLTVLAGDWGYIYGGNNTDNPLNGDVHLTVGGNVNAGLDYATLGHEDSTNGNHRIYGGGRSDVNGTIYLEFTGNARAINVFGGSRGETHVDNIELTVSGGESMALYGAGYVAPSEATEDGAQTVGTVNIYYQGGTIEQVFGGTLGQNLTGDVNLYLTGGNITRRVYGGCYNETTTSGLSVSFKTAYQVTGNINMYIGGTNISCDLNEPGTSNKYMDLSIYAHSRYTATGTDAENSSIYFVNKAAYDTYKNKLKYNDGTFSAMAFLMGNTTAADNLHYHCYQADGATVKYTCVYDADEIQGNTAQLVLVDGVELIYKGQAIEPATVVYGENWTGEQDLQIVYADNNKAGTASASITKEDATATLTFELADGPKVAKIGSTEYYSLQAAVNAATEKQYVQLVDNIEEDITVASDLYLDLAGFSITGTVTVNEGAVLYGMDSTTDDYDCTDGYGTIKVAGAGTVAKHYKTSVTGKVRRYLTYTDSETGAVSFHRIYLGVTSMSLRPGVKGVGYKATFRADAKAQELLKSDDAFGYTLWVETADESVIGSVTKGLAKDKFSNEGTVALRLQNFDVQNYGEHKIYATVYLQLADGTQIVSAEYFFTLRSMLERINEDLETNSGAYSETQMTALQAMLKDASATASWTIANIMNWQAPAAQ